MNGLSFTSCLTGCVVSEWLSWSDCLSRCALHCSVIFSQQQAIHKVYCTSIFTPGEDGDLPPKFLETFITTVCILIQGLYRIFASKFPNLKISQTKLLLIFHMHFEYTLPEPGLGVVSSFFKRVLALIFLLFCFEFQNSFSTDYVLTILKISNSPRPWLKVPFHDMSKLSRPGKAHLSSPQFLNCTNPATMIKNASKLQLEPGTTATVYYQELTMKTTGTPPSLNCPLHIVPYWFGRWTQMYYNLNTIFTPHSLSFPQLLREFKTCKEWFSSTCLLRGKLLFFQSEDVTSFQIKYARYLKHEPNENTQHAIHTKSVHSHQHG